jgi:hypothetical protein
MKQIYYLILTYSFLNFIITNFIYFIIELSLNELIFQIYVIIRQIKQAFQ